MATRGAGRLRAAPGKAWLQIGDFAGQTGHGLRRHRFFGDSTGYFLMFWLRSIWCRTRNSASPCWACWGGFRMIKDAAAVFGGYPRAAWCKTASGLLAQVVMTIAAALIIAGPHSKDETKRRWSCLPAPGQLRHGTVERQFPLHSSGWI
jgi:hypothetical protein